MRKRTRQLFGNGTRAPRFGRRSALEQRDVELLDATTELNEDLTPVWPGHLTAAATFHVVRADASRVVKIELHSAHRSARAHVEEGRCGVDVRLQLSPMLTVVRARGIGRRERQQ